MLATLLVMTPLATKADVKTDPMAIAVARRTIAASEVDAERTRLDAALGRAASDLASLQQEVSTMLGPSRPDRQWTSTGTRHSAPASPGSPHASAPDR